MLDFSIFQEYPWNRSHSNKITKNSDLKQQIKYRIIAHLQKMWMENKKLPGEIKGPHFGKPTNA